jgi:O-methyltransferase
MNSFKDKLSELLQLSKLQWKLASMIPQNDQKQLLKRIREVSKHVPCPHNESDILSFGIKILSIPRNQDGCIVEAGSYKGGSTAKFSLFAKLADRKLVVFDSFEGLPDNTENHDKSLFYPRLVQWR